ncbi:MAG: HDIG domain-containing protein [bacterium]|nr:HDIG domain-containing protein [bacterium]
MKQTIPQPVLDVAAALTAGGFEAYLVGGCVRDLLRGAVHGERVEPKDWDIATNARPEEIQKACPDSVYENEFGTVGVKIRTNDLQPTTDNKDSATKSGKLANDKQATTDVIEVTTYRVDGTYHDHRHPEEVQFAARIEDDLARRDFTVNAMAVRITNNKWFIPSSGEGQQTTNDITDPFDGHVDLKAKVIRAVGNPTLRFREDALRLLRAVRFAAELGFSIEDATGQAIQAESRLLEEIAPERVRDELVKLIMAPRAASGIRMLEGYRLLAYIIPELREGIDCGQNKHHIYTVFDHNVRALDYAAGKGYPLHIRLGALLHDVGKPRTKRGDGPDSTFYNHEVVGGRMTRVIMERLKFSTEVADAVTHLVRQHLFYYNVGEVSAAGVRRFIARVGIEMVDDILKVREADRIGSGVPKAFPYKLRHLQFMIDKVRHDPVHPKMLALRGDELMRLVGAPPGPVVGQILRILLDEVLEEPSRNSKEYLERRARVLHALPPADLAPLDRAARSHVEELEADAEEVLKRRHHVS